MPLEQSKSFTLSNVALSVSSTESEKKRREIMEGERLYNGFKERFGDGFLGFETLETLFTLPDGAKLLETNQELKDHAYQSLYEKFHEHDGELWVWLDRIARGELPEDELSHWMLVYHPEANMKNREEEYEPISIESLWWNIDAQRKRRHRPTKWIRSIEDRLIGEPWMHQKLTPGWTIVSRDMLEETRNKDIDQQNIYVKEPAEDRYFERKFRKTRTPIDIVFDCALAQENKTPHLTGFNFERTQQRVNLRGYGERMTEYSVIVGGSQSDGVIIYINLPTIGSRDLGMCIVR